MRTLLTLVAMTSLLMTLTEGVGNLALCATHANGCSTPLHMALFYKTLFTPSCNQHDNCYRCGAHYGLSKDDCDTRFLNSMNAACAIHDAGRRGLELAKRSTCTVFAHDVFYEAVHLAGVLFYHAAGSTEAYCVSDAHTVRGCLGV